MENMEKNLPFGIYDAICQACDVQTVVNDLGLCEDCNAKMDRDLIRKRAWDYSASAFGCPVDKREELRTHIIAQYGEALELLAAEPSHKGPSTTRKKKRKRKR
jgi:hypothetical protein